MRYGDIEFGGEPRGEKLSTLVLADRAGRTAVTLTMLFPSKEARDEAIKFGAEPNWDKLDEVLASTVGQ